VPGCTTGVLAAVGTNLKRGAELAFEEINASGFLGSAKLVPYYEDDGMDLAKSPTIVELLINGKKVVALTVGCATGNVLASGKIANQAQIPYVVGNASGPGVGDIGPYVFRTSTEAKFLIDPAVKTIVPALKVKTAAIVFGTNEPSLVEIADAYEKSLKAAGVNVLAREGIASFQEADFSSVITKIKPLNPDILLPLLADAQGANLMVQARRAGMTTQFVGHSGHSTAVMFQVGRESVVGEIFATPWSIQADHAANVGFVKAYRAKYSADPDLFAANGYTPTWVLARAIKTAGSADPKKIQQALAAMKTITEGVPLGKGIITFDGQNGKVEGVVVQIQRDGSFGVWKP
jgi:branched-chain amino acid transport system substrate-binding protein